MRELFSVAPGLEYDAARTGGGGYCAEGFTMVLILDAYNVIHAGRSLGGALADLRVHSLCQWLVTQPALGKVTLVLDGRPKPHEPSPNEFPALNLVYSGAGVSADSLIGQIVERARRRKALTVVTNDRAVIRDVRSLGARVLSCEAFLGSLVAPARRQRRAGGEKSAPPAPGETDQWLKEFGFSTPPPTRQPPAGSEDEQIGQIDMDELLGGGGA